LIDSKVLEQLIRVQVGAGCSREKNGICDATCSGVWPFSNSIRELPPLVRRDFPIRLMQESKPGPGAARNMGAAEALGEILAFINADCRADHHWLANALSHLQSSPDKTVLGGEAESSPSTSRSRNVVRPCKRPLLSVVFRII
jgi:hypothetical protein